MSLSILSFEREQAQLAAKAATGRQRRSWMERRIDEAHARRIAAWGQAAPWMPRQVIVPLAREGITPDSDAGMLAINHSIKFAHLRHVGTVNAAAASGRGIIRAPQVEEAGFSLGGVGHAIGRAANIVSNDVIDPIQRDVIDPVKRATGVAASEELVGSPEVAGAPIYDPVKTGTRYGFAGLQAPYEALQGVATRPWMGSPAIQQEIKQGSAPTGNPFDPGQLTVVQMARGRSAGSGILPGVDSPAAKAAAAVQRKTRGAIAGQAATPGRLAAAAIVEPGTEPYKAMSGLVDLAVAWKLDPANLALTKIGDINEARKIFDTTGVYTNGIRKFIHGPTRDAYLESKKLEPVFEKIAQSRSIRDLDYYSKHQFSMQQLADFVDARTAEQAKTVMRAALEDQRTVPKWGYGLDSSVMNNRWFHQVPSHWVNRENPDDAARQAERLLLSVKADPKDIDAIMYRIARADTPGKFEDAMVNVTGRALHGALTEKGVPEDVAKELTRFHKTQDSETKFFVNEVGNTPTITTMTNGGKALDITGPVLPTENLNSVVPLPDYRELSRAASSLRKVYELPGVAGSRTLAEFFTEKVFKVGALTRIAWPVRVIAEEQVRMATAGLDSMFHHPISYVAWATGSSDKQLLEKIGKGGEDVGGVPFGQLLHDQFNQALGNVATYAGPEGVDTDRLVAKYWDSIRQGDRGFARAWGDRLSHFHMDPVSNAVAKSAVKGEGFRAVQDSFWDGPLAKQRQLVMDGGGWRTELATREGADAYIEDVVWDQLNRMTVGKPDLLDAVANGADMRQNMNLRKEFVSKLDGYVKTGDAPAYVVGKVPLRGQTITSGAKVAEGYDLAINKLFTHLMSRPTNYLSRSPAFRQFYWQRAEELFPTLDPATQEQVLRAAERANLKGVVKRLSKVSRAGDTGIPVYRFSEDTLDDAVHRMQGAYFGLGGTPDKIWRKSNAENLFEMEVAPKNPLRLSKSLNDTAGEAAARHLLPEDDYRALADLADSGDVEGMLTRARKLGLTISSADEKFLLSEPTGTAMDAIGGALARKAGYDAVIAERGKDILVEHALGSYPEYVALRPSALARTDALSLEEIDTVAKAHALDKTKELLYDTTRRSQFMDAARIVFPFGEAWKEVFTVWAKLAKEQPQVVRRGQQVIQSARGSGFFYTNPEDGQEYFNFPGSKFVTQKLTGVGFPSRGRAAGLNIAASGLPGLGPAPQLVASMVLPDEAEWDGIKEIISPYGNPDNLGSFLPGWAQKAQSTDWFQDVPIAGKALTPLRVLFPQTENQKRIFGGTVEYVMGNLATTGAYDMTDPDDYARLTHDATNKALGLYALRGLAQVVTPTAPAYVSVAKAKDGQMYEIVRLASDYQELVDKYKDYDVATDKFIERYGDKAYLAITPHSQSQVYMPAVTKQARAWEGENKKFVEQFPHVSGFFGPNSGDFDYNVYQRQIDDGTRAPLTPDEWKQNANHRLASYQYAKARDEVGDHPTKDQRDLLRQYQDELMRTYEGYDPTGGGHGKDISPERGRLELLNAAKSEEMRDTDLGEAIQLYFEARQQALDKLEAAGLSSLNSKVAAAPLRAWLRDIGSQIGDAVPTFRLAWDRLLYDEVSLDKDGDGS